MHHKVGYRTVSILISALLFGIIVGGSLPVSAQQPTPIPPLPADARLIASTRQGQLLVSLDEKTFTPTGMKGNEITASPDGQRLVYARDNGLYLLQDGEERAFNVVGTFEHTHIQFSIDGQTLLWLLTGYDAAYLNRTRLIGNWGHYGATQMLSAAVLAGAPVSDPVTGRVLLIQPDGSGETDLSSIDLFCRTEARCFSGQEAVGNVPYEVTWAAYRPDGKQLAFSEAGGDIYLLALDSGKVTPLLVDGEPKTRLAFSPDGTQLAYLRAQGKLYIYTFTTKTDEPVSGLADQQQIASFAWLK